MEFTLLGNALVAAAALYASIRVLGRNPRFSAEAPRAWDVVLGASMFGLLVGRLWAMISSGTNPLSHLFDIVLIRSGVDTIGATLGFLVALGWAYRSRLSVATDAVAAPILFGLAGWHGGCLVRGACTGIETSVPWGLEGIAGVSRHPVEVYTAVLLLIGATFVAKTWRRVPSVRGLLGPLALVIAAFSRAITEPLRLHLGVGLVGFYVGGGVVGVLVVLLRHWQHNRSRPEEPAKDS